MMLTFDTTLNKRLWRKFLSILEKAITVNLKNLFSEKPVLRRFFIVYKFQLTATQNVWSMNVECFHSINITLFVIENKYFKFFPHLNNGQKYDWHYITNFYTIFIYKRIFEWLFIYLTFILIAINVIFSGYACFVLTFLFFFFS